ncbi:MAG: RsmD family RNA methyltransferase [Acidimicrobiales bacterium]
MFAPTAWARSRATTLDAFAGNSAARSGGPVPSAATFAEVDPSALAVLRANVAALGIGDRSRVVAGPARAAVAGDGPWDLVLLDPPYAFDGWAELLDEVAAALSPAGLVVVESDREVRLPAALRGVRSRTYGGTVVQFARPSGAPS